MDNAESSNGYQQRRKQMEERMRAVLRPLFSRRAANVAAAAGSCGLWKAPHVSQCCQWDCGVSCVQMVLKGLGRDAERSSLLASLGTRSVWTIDLAMLLHRQGVRFMYGTRTAGVTEAYSTIDFYRANFDRDAPRVQSLFKAAEEANVGAVQKAFSWQELAMLVSSYNYAAIVLVDSRYLHPSPWRSPTAAAAAAATAAFTTPPLAPPSPAATSPAFVPPSPTSTPATATTSPPVGAARSDHGVEGSSRNGLPEALSWSTPKRNREEAAREGGGVQGWGLDGVWSTGPNVADGMGDGPRRRRRRPAATSTTTGALTIVDDKNGDRETSSEVSTDERSTARAVNTTGVVRQALATTLSSVGTMAMSEPPLSPRDASTKHLRVSPAPYAIQDDGEDGASEVRLSATPRAAPQRGRKVLVTNPDGSLRPVYSAAATTSIPAVKQHEQADRSEGDSCTTQGGSPAQGSFATAESLAVSTPHAGVPCPVGIPGDVSPVLLASPPPLKSVPADGWKSPSATAAPTVIDGSARCGSSPRPHAVVAAAADESPPEESPTSYCGHYILLVGWSEADGVFLARDPALPSPPSVPSSSAKRGEGEDGGDPNAHLCIALTPEALDRARRSYGTDEDVLLIDLGRSRRGGVPTAPLAAAAAATALAASAGSPAAAASALVGLLAMAAAAAAAGAESSGFKEWAWPDRTTWFGGIAGGGDGDGEGGSEGIGGKGDPSKNRGGSEANGRGGVVEGRGMVHSGGAESAARRLASFLSLAASGLRFPTVAVDGYRVPKVPWGNGADVGSSGTGACSVGRDHTAAGEEEKKKEQERWAIRMASAVLLEGGRRAAYTMEGLLQGGRRAAYTMEGFLQGGAHTMEGLLEGGLRAAYNLRDQLADVADAPGGAGAECCAVAVLNSPGSPVATSRIGAAVVSPA